MIKIVKSLVNSYKARIVDLFTKNKKEKKNIWLIGGHGGKLYDDNSKVVFEYVNKNLDDIDIYWVVDKNADCVNEIKKNGKIIEKGSFENYLMFFRAKVVIFSHSLSSDIAPYLYVFPGMRKKYDEVLKVFISHGVEGLKKKSIVNKGFGKLKEEILKGYDLQFVVGEFEKKIKINEWGIEANKIEVTGLPRFDKLDLDKIDCKDIFYMPTWRPWIKKEGIENSDYYKNIMKLLQNDKLNEILKGSNMTLKIYIHQLMHEYFNNFNISLPSNMKLLSKDMSVQKQLIECKVLITDYSSVCWDALFMGKPIIFFQFDLDRYESEIGSYLNLNKDLFGDVVFNVKECISKIELNIENDFEVNKKYLDKRVEYIKYLDKKNTDRVISAILKRIKK